MTVEPSPYLHQHAVPAVEIGRRAMLLGGLGALLAGCGWMYESWAWNQRLTIEVETPEGLKTGSAVMYVYWREPDGLSGGHYGTDYVGEATFVEVTRGKYLVAIIGEYTKRIAEDVFPQQVGIEPEKRDELFTAFETHRGTVEVPYLNYPKLVYFPDPADPMSVQQVVPGNLATVFGEGVRLKRMTLTITDEPVTSGEIVKVLPWLATIGGARKLDGEPYATITAKNRLANDLSILNLMRARR